jgi:hypothetical protein
MLATTDLWFRYQDEPVLKGLTLDFSRHAVTGLVGANGCGKSTLFMNWPPPGRSPHGGKNPASAPSAPARPDSETRDRSWHMNLSGLLRPQQGAVLWQGKALDYSKRGLLALRQHGHRMAGKIQRQPLQHRLVLIAKPEIGRGKHTYPDAVYEPERSAAPAARGSAVAGQGAGLQQARPAGRRLSAAVGPHQAGHRMAGKIQRQPLQHRLVLIAKMLVGLLFTRVMIRYQQMSTTLDIKLYQGDFHL